MSHRVVVIGGGVGGLSAAMRLAGRGLRVTLIEKNPLVGGKLNLRIVPHPNRPGERPFSFDTGPSLLTLPFVFQDLFRAVGLDVRDFLHIRRLDPISRFVWRDGTSFELRANLDDTLEEVRRMSPRDIDGFRRFHQYGQSIWNLAGESFLSNTPMQMIRGDGEFNPILALRAASVPFRIGMFRRFAGVVKSHIKDRRLREVMFQYATYFGASPFAAPATLAVIPFCEMHFGGWYPSGGMYSIARALESAAKQLGVEIVTNTPATRIEVDRATDSKSKPRVKAVVTTAGRFLCDAVVCNADTISAYAELIASADRPHFDDHTLKRIEPGGSGMCLLLGVDGRFDSLAHHTKFMPDDYASDLRAMFETRTTPADPCIYVCRSTATDASQAPAGCENLFVLVSAPPLVSNINWAAEGPAYEKRMIETLETRFALTDLSKRIVVRHRITPVDLERLYRANAGSIYGVSGNGLRNAFKRPANADKHVGGLFFAGGSTHPGGGLPLVAWSGKIAAGLACDFLGVKASDDAVRAAYSLAPAGEASRAD